jgi:hypothetical protein
VKDTDRGDCAAPANVVADMTVAAVASMPFARASTPKAAPKLSAAGVSAAIRLAPSR